MKLSLMNAFSQAGQSIEKYAGAAGLAEQKAELERQQAAFVSQLQEGVQTRLAHVQGGEQRETAQVTATAQGEQQRETQTHANELPMTEAQKAADKNAQGQLKVSEGNLDVARTNAGTVGWDMMQDSEGNEYRVNQGHGKTEKRKPDGSWESIPKLPENLHKVGAASHESFTPEQGALMAALAEKGISLPTGFRSKEQQRTLYQGILDRNPGKSVDEIASLVMEGKLDLGAMTKAVNTAGTAAGRVRIAENEIKEFAPLIRDASAKVDRGKFIPINQLLQLADEKISDPDLLDLKILLNSMMNAYDQLAARGGTDKDKRAEAHSLLMTAQSPEALLRGVATFEIEAAAAGRAANDAIKARNFRNENHAPPGGSIAPPPAAAPASLPKFTSPTDPEFQKLPAGSHFLDANGVERIK